MAAPRKIRVLVVDDSAVMRRLLAEMLGGDEAIEVVGTAPDPYVARDKIKALNPDVLTLDIEMPHMDGLAFLRNLMRLRPMPVVMCASTSRHNVNVALDALALGAVDFVAKPSSSGTHGVPEFAQELITKVKMAARAHLRPAVEPIAMKVEDSHPACVVIPKRSAPTRPGSEQIIAIGASTGGTEAIKEVLMRLPAGMPGIVITQHIPKAFSGPFAQRMNAISDLTVSEAADGQQILAGHVYIAPGDSHLLVTRAGNRYVCELSNGALVNRHRPSVDVLFRSVAQSAGARAIGVMLTGMGRDGAEGMKEMRDAGAATIAQDEASSVVWGMPGAAVEAGAVQWQCPLLQIADRIQSLCKEAGVMLHGSNASA